MNTIAAAMLHSAAATSPLLAVLLVGEAATLALEAPSLRFQTASMPPGPAFMPAGTATMASKASLMPLEAALSPLRAQMLAVRSASLHCGDRNTAARVAIVAENWGSDAVRRDNIAALALQR